MCVCVCVCVHAHLPHRRGGEAVGLRLQECRSCLGGRVLGGLGSRPPAAPSTYRPMTTGTEVSQCGHRRMDAGWTSGNASFRSGCELAHSHGCLGPAVQSIPDPPSLSMLMGISRVQSLEPYIETWNYWYSVGLGSNGLLLSFFSLLNTYFASRLRARRAE